VFTGAAHTSTFTRARARAHARTHGCAIAVRILIGGADERAACRPILLSRATKNGTSNEPIVGRTTTNEVVDGGLASHSVVSPTGQLSVNVPASLAGRLNKTFLRTFHHVGSSSLPMQLFEFRRRRCHDGVPLEENPTSVNERCRFSLPSQRRRGGHFDRHVKRRRSILVNGRLDICFPTRIPPAGGRVPASVFIAVRTARSFYISAFGSKGLRLFSLPIVGETARYVVGFDVCQGV
jgi:hypothetical protein